MSPDIIERECWCRAIHAQRIGEFAWNDSSSRVVFPLVRCEGCGVLAIFPQPSDAELDAAYAGEYYGQTRSKFIGPVASVIGWFQRGRARHAAKWIPKGSRVLDIGCGNGGFLKQLQQRGYQVEGTERSAQSAARVSSGILVHHGDLLDINLPAESFDAVTIWHVFEHVRQPAETMQKIRSLLRPGGLLIMAVPNAESAQARRYGIHWLHHDPPRHLFGFGTKSLGRLLAANGFEVEELTTYSLEQDPFGEIQSRLNARGIPRDRLYEQLKGVSCVGLQIRIADLGRMALLAIPALIRSAFESARGVGATLIVVARANAGTRDV